MRKFLLLFAFFPILCFGQNEIKYMEFMQIPIEGTIAEFRDALIQKHKFYNPRYNDGMAYLKGKFWRFNDVEIRLKGSLDEEIHNVVVKVSKYDYRDEIVELIKKLDELYSKHHYEEKSILNLFTWYTDNGYIVLQEWKMDSDDVFVIYNDKTELEKKKAEIKKEDSDL